MATEELESLLLLLSKYGCTRFKKAGLEIELGPQSTKSISAPLPATDTEINLESMLPPDLRADDLMSEDKVLNWSSPDAGVDSSLPLTADQ